MIRKIAAILVSGFMLVSFAACGSSGAASAAQTNPAPRQQAGTSGSTFIGKVTAVSGNTITLDVLARNNQQNGRQQNGNNAQRAGVSPNTATNPTVSNPPGAPSGGNSQHNGNGGGRPNGGGGFNLTPTGESKTITVTSGTAITIGGRGNSSAGTMADIKTDVILSVSMDGDTVKSIVINNFGNGRQPGGQNQNHSQALNSSPPAAA